MTADMIKKPKKIPGPHTKRISKLQKQVGRLKRRCAEAEEALHAIQHGGVDALVIYTDEGEKIYTIQGAETTYRLMVESINEGAATLIGDGTILYCNRRFAEMLSAPLESLIATSIHQYVAPENQLAFSELLKRGINEKCRIEANFIRSDGSHLPVMISLNNFSSTTAPEVYLIATDLTQSKITEDVIRQDALRAETMTEITRSLVEASLDESTIMNIVAEAAVRLIGDACIIRVFSPDHRYLHSTAHYHPDPHTNQIISQIIGETDLSTSVGVSGRVIQSGRVVLIPALNPYYAKKIIRAEFPGLTDQLRLYGMLAVPVRMRDEIIGVLELLSLAKEPPYNLDDQHIAQRIADHMALAMTNARLYHDLQNALHTEQTMRMQLIQAEKLSALNRMMATVVHEINNPVQTIKNCIYLAEQDIPPGLPLREYLGMASSEIDRISKLVSSLRDIYRQPKTMLMQTLELSGLLSDVHLLLETHLQHQKVTWVQELCEKPIWVNAISDHLKQVFLNLSLNAIESMQPEGGTLFISTGINVDKNEAAVTFTDTGCGIEAANLPRIFEPFYTTKEGGGGLGLPICYEIVQHHSGRITAESQLGKGSTFTVWLPVVLTSTV